MSRTTSNSAWLILFIVLVAFASTKAVHADTVTVTLKNGKTYEVKTNRRGELVGAKNRQVEILFLGTTSHASPSSDTPVYEWAWQIRMKKRGTFKLTVTTPFDETASTSIEVVGRGVVSGNFFDSVEYPTLWAWLHEPETTWIPFVFSFEDTQSDKTFELTQWTQFDAAFKKWFVMSAYHAAGLIRPDEHPSNETVTPPFDDRDWALGNRFAEGNRVVLEYVLSGETVENWSELITVQSFVGATKTPRDLLSVWQQQLLKDCPNAMWNVIRESDSDIVVEWRTEGCVGAADTDDQYEITRALSGPLALHTVSYVTKRQPHLPEMERSEWIDRIGRAEVHLSE